MTPTDPDSAQALATTLITPDGPFTLVCGTGAVLASGWTDDVDRLLPLIHASLRPGRAHVRFLDEEAAPSDGVLAQAVRAVRAYYDGDLVAPATVPVEQVSGPVRSHAWEVLRLVGPGAPVTYAEYAAGCGRPTAVRAAAGACAANAAALFVPCHRVLRSDGGPGGFRWGSDIKDRLLARESSAVG